MRGGGAGNRFIPLSEAAKFQSFENSSPVPIASEEGVQGQ
jgi:hypothetical protein